MSSDIGKLIKIRLKELGKTQAWLAEKCDVSNVAVTKWIKTGKISRENVQAAANALKFSIDKLLGSDELMAENEIERQLLLFYRNIKEEDQDKLISYANGLYSINNPDDKRANPHNGNVKQK